MSDANELFVTVAVDRDTGRATISTNAKTHKTVAVMLVNALLETARAPDEVEIVDIAVKGNA